MRFTTDNIEPPWTAAKLNGCALTKDRRGKWDFICPNIEFAPSFQYDDFAVMLNRMRGDVILGGLGPGVMAWNCCRHRKIKSVTVIEFDQDVIDFLPMILPKERWKNRDKLRIVLGDVFKIRLRGKYDFFYDDTDICETADFKDFFRRVDVQMATSWEITNTWSRDMRIVDRR